MKRILVAALALVSMATATPVAHAGTSESAKPDRHPERRTEDVTFTKWLTDLPNAPSAAGAPMVGVVGGDVGDGSFAGMVLRDRTTPQSLWIAQALYAFNGDKHAFVAYNRIVENDGVTPATATITGVVIAGWMKGARVTGEYTVLDSCPISTPKNVFENTCFQGTLHLRLGRDD